MKLGGILIAILVLLVVYSVFSRIRKLDEQSRRIEKTLDYSKMKKWEDDED